MSVTGTNISLTLRQTKGSELTYAELDGNQSGLKEALEAHSHNEFAATSHGHAYDDLTDPPAIPSIAGLLDETAHDLLDHTGLTGIPAAYTLPTASTTVLGGVKVDGTTVLIADGVISSTGGSGGSITDHGLLTGLADDDHSQYHTDARGDARYSQTSHNHSLNNLAEKSYNSLTDKPSIPSVAGLLDETAHDALDHTGLTGVGNVTQTGVETLTNKTLTAPTITGFTESGTAPAAGTSFTIGLANGTDHEITLNGNGTITLPAAAAGKSYSVAVNYLGAYVATFAGGTTIKWAGGTPPAATSVNGKTDIYIFKCNRAGTVTMGLDGGRNI